MTLEYRIKSVYGVDRVYLVDDQVQGHITTLTGHKTLSDTDMIALKALGFTFTQVV